MATKKGKAAAEVPAPVPLTPPECSMDGYSSMLIDIHRLRQSDFDAIDDDSAWRAGLNLWFSAWISVPAGSLRADDASLAKAAGLGRDLATWAKVKAGGAMQGFTLCQDGRVYHRHVSIVALGIWIDKLIRKHAGQRGNRGSVDAQQREHELRSIEFQIATAAKCLRALDPTAAALTKAAKHEAQCQPQSVPQCGGDAPAMGPQGNGREGNGIQKDGPSQGTGQVISIGGAVA